MLFKTLHKNSLTVFLLTPLLVLGLWLRFFVIDIVHFTALDNPSMPIWDSLIVPYLGSSVFTAGISTYLLALLTGWSLNRIVSKYALTHQQSMLPLLMFGLLTAPFLTIQKLNPVWFFSLFLILAIERLLAGVNKRNPTTVCFDSGFLVGIGSLIFAKGIFFFPVILIGMGLLRLLTFRNLTASILGLSFPFILSFGWFFMFDKGLWFLSELNENLVTNPGQYNYNMYSLSYMIFMVVILGSSIINIFRYMPLQKIIVRRYLRVFIWIIFLTGAAVLSPFFSIETMPIAALGSSVAITFWLDRMRIEWIREAIFILIISLCLAGQFLFY